MKKKVIAVFTNIHGYQYEHASLINKVKEKYEIVQYIYLGDLIDRGPWVKWVLQSVRNIMESDTPIVLLRGDHENELLNLLNTNDIGCFKFLYRMGAKLQLSLLLVMSMR